ncbi:aminoglycoside phosphotransferase family protein [Thiolapillus brandeum]|uniref:Aminoglycoside phosphotransferase n=1 Tax=Thiolapillus brandeum TaxID=1076588 RepID=A0A7U6GKW3_9GAMM|nr:phosphotransferase [Thiolapillus brandeum]BAO45553.1 aminoglycoside phosphotransferase [Thiolapillus brandeum]
MSDRQILLEQWLNADCGMSGFSLEPASEDASFRRYFRLTVPDGSTFVVMDAPPEKEDCAPFVDIANRLLQAGVHAPAVYQQDLKQGFLLLEDLGARNYLDVLDGENVERLYGDALAALMSMQACIDPGELPEYDEQLLRQEMSLFRDWLLLKHLELELDPDDEQMLEASFATLVDSALEQPRVFVHRDYHSRNLMADVEHAPGVLDFQDAVRGPVTYDAVSLLRDCYVSWPSRQVDEWAWGYFQLAVQSGVMRDEHEDRFLGWFDLMGAQRHLKAAGIFARLNHRDGKPGYLKDIPRTLGYVVEVAQRHDRLVPLADFISRRVLPRL